MMRSRCHCPSALLSPLPLFPFLILFFLIIFSFREKRGLFGCWPREGDEASPTVRLRWRLFLVVWCLKLVWWLTCSSPDPRTLGFGYGNLCSRPAGKRSGYGTSCGNRVGGWYHPDPTRTRPIDRPTSTPLLLDHAHSGELGSPRVCLGLSSDRARIELGSCVTPRLFKLWVYILNSYFWKVLWQFETLIHVIII